jgi:hypothetical protein
MGLFKRYESEDFDESYFDDADYGDFEESGSSKPFLVKAIAMILAVTGIAYGANIALTTGSGTKAEFGQGFQVLTACDTAVGDGIDIIPYAGFINDSGSGKFSLDSIILEKINKSCVGNDFIIQVYGDTGTALTVSETATNGTNYQTYDLARFWFKDSATVVNLDMSFIDVDVLSDTSDSTLQGDYESNKNSVQITFDPDRTPSFADATQIRKITIQTVKHGS